MKKKGFRRDLLSLGVAAVCLNNARNGWKRVESERVEGRGMRERCDGQRRLRE